MKFSSALLAVVISTMVSPTEAVKIQEEAANPLEATSAVFEIADYNDNDLLYKQEFKTAMEKLLESDEVPGDEKFLNKVYKEADKADGKDGIVTFDSLLASFTEALGVEGEEACEAAEAEEVEEAEEAEVAEEEEKGAEEADDGPRCFIDPIFTEE